MLHVHRSRIVSEQVRGAVAHYVALCALLRCALADIDDQIHSLHYMLHDLLVQSKQASNDQQWAQDAKRSLLVFGQHEDREEKQSSERQPS